MSHEPPAPRTSSVDALLRLVDEYAADVADAGSPISIMGDRMLVEKAIVRLWVEAAELAARVTSEGIAAELQKRIPDYGSTVEHAKWQAAWRDAARIALEWTDPEGES